MSTPDYVLPWEDGVNHRITSLFKIGPPKIKYPGGSRDEDVNRRFLKRMDHYLFRSYIVRCVLVGECEHHSQAVNPGHIVEVVQIECDLGRVLPAADSKLNILWPPGGWVLVGAMIAVNAVNMAADWVALPFGPTGVAIS